MNVEIGPEAALFPEKEYTNAIFVMVRPCPQDIYSVFLLIGPLGMITSSLVIEFFKKMYECAIEKSQLFP